MKPSYREGVECIAWNDEPSILDVEEMSGFASVMVLAAAFRVDQDRVARDVVRYRLARHLCACFREEDGTVAEHSGGCQLHPEYEPPGK